MIVAIVNDLKNIGHVKLTQEVVVNQYLAICHGGGSKNILNTNLSIFLPLQP